MKRICVGVLLCVFALGGCAGQTTLATRLPDGSMQYDVTTKTKRLGSPIVTTQYRKPPGKNNSLQLISSASATPPETAVLGAITGGVANGLGIGLFSGILGGNGSAHVGSITNINSNTAKGVSTTVVK